MSLEHDPARQKKRGGSFAAFAPPDEFAADTIREFCRRWRLSLGMYYKMRRAGLGPREMRCGAKVLITRPAQAEWAATRETLEK
jgi:hypothetical protein